MYTLTAVRYTIGVYTAIAVYTLTCVRHPRCERFELVFREHVLAVHVDTLELGD